MARRPRFDFDQRISIPDFAFLVGISVPHAYREINHGTIPEPVDEKLILGHALKHYCDKIRAKIPRGTRRQDNGEAPPKRAGERLDEERVRLTKERADMAAMERRKMQGELVSLPVVEAVLTDAFSNINSRLLGMPSKMAARVIGQKSLPVIKDLLETEVANTLDELSKVGEQIAEEAARSAFDDPGLDAGDDGIALAAEDDRFAVGRQGSEA